MAEILLPIEGFGRHCGKCRFVLHVTHRKAVCVLFNRYPLPEDWDPTCRAKEGGDYRAGTENRCPACLACEAVTHAKTDL